MTKQNLKPKLAIASLGTTLVVGLFNTASVVIAYEAFVPKASDQNTNSLIQDRPVTSNAASTSATAAQAVSSATSTTRTVTPARKSNTPIVIGQPAQPAYATADANGKVTYHWCSGSNPELEDGVCEAVLSIAADPSPSNPHLSDKAKKSLSLLPKNCSLTMDESSWKATSATSGTMRVTAHTQTYGDVKLLVTLEKQNGIWVLTDGQLA